MNSVAPPRFQFETFNPREEGSSRVRTAWISDVHLGTRASGAARLLDFLREYDFDTLYVVGDLVDIWQMRRSRYWPQQHNDVIQKILRKARKGTRVIYIPGNHDEMISSFYGAYGDIMIQKHAIHRTADGRRILVIHGHALDTVVQTVTCSAMVEDFDGKIEIVRNGQDARWPHSQDGCATALPWRSWAGRARAVCRKCSRDSPREGQYRPLTILFRRR